MVLFMTDGCFFEVRHNTPAQTTFIMYSALLFAIRSFSELQPGQLLKT